MPAEDYLQETADERPRQWGIPVGGPAQWAFNPEWLGRAALERYSGEELEQRWQKAKRDPENVLFDYDTGALYYRRGQAWETRTGSAFSRIVDTAGNAPTPVSPDVVERAAQRWLMAEAVLPNNERIDPFDNSKTKMMKLAEAYPRLYAWDPVNRTLIDRATRTTFTWRSNALQPSGQLSESEFAEITSPLEDDPGEALSGPTKRGGPVNTPAGESAAEGEEATPTANFNPVEVLTGEKEPPPGWTLRDWQSVNGQRFRSLEAVVGYDDQNLPLTEGYSVWVQPDGSLMPLEGETAEEQLSAAKRMYDFNIGDEIKPSYLGGFAEGYTATNPQIELMNEYGTLVDRFGKYAEPDMTQRLREMQGANLPQVVAPQYYEWDNYYQFGGKPGTYIRQVQQAMVAAGVMTEEQAAAEDGFWGETSGGSMYQVMYEANANGMTWNEVLERRAAIKTMFDLQYPDEDSKTTGTQLTPYSAPAYLEPDYAAVSQTVKKVFADQLGRDPHDYEMSLLSDQLYNDFRAQFDAEVAADRSTYEAGNRAIETKTEQAGGTYRAVDPLARLAETFATEYESELGTIDRREQLHSNLGLLMSNLSGLESAVGSR